MFRRRVLQAAGEPVRLAVAQQPGRQRGELVDVLAGVVQVNDLSRCGEQLIGKVPDHAAPSPSTTSWLMRSLPRRRVSAAASWPNRPAFEGGR